jgi:hypothetical protein
MPRPNNNVETSRLNLEMAVKVRKQLELIRDQTEAHSLAEVIQRAVSVYNFLLNEKNNGQQLISRGPKGEREVVLL